MLPSYYLFTVIKCLVSNFSSYRSFPHSLSLRAKAIIYSTYLNGRGFITSKYQPLKLFRLNTTTSTICYLQESVFCDHSHFSVSLVDSLLFNLSTLPCEIHLFMAYIPVIAYPKYLNMLLFILYESCFKVQFL